MTLYFCQGTRWLVFAKLCRESHYGAQVPWLRTLSRHGSEPHWEGEGQHRKPTDYRKMYFASDRCSPGSHHYANVLFKLHLLSLMQVVQQALQTATSRSCLTICHSLENPPHLTNGMENYQIDQSYFFLLNLLQEADWWSQACSSGNYWAHAPHFAPLRIRHFVFSLEKDRIRLLSGAMDVRKDLMAEIERSCQDRPFHFSPNYLASKLSYQKPTAMLRN